MKWMAVSLITALSLCWANPCFSDSALPNFSSGGVPDSVNLENQFLPVKLQVGGACAVCAATDLVEAAYFRNTGKRINLTEAYFSYRNIRNNADSVPLHGPFFNPNDKWVDETASPESSGVRLFIPPQHWKLKVAEIEKGLVAGRWDGGHPFSHISRICNGSYCVGYEPVEANEFYDFMRNAFKEARNDCHVRYQTWLKSAQLKFDTAKAYLDAVFAAEEKAELDAEKQLPIVGPHHALGLVTGIGIAEGGRLLIGSSRLASGHECRRNFAALVTPSAAGALSGILIAEGGAKWIRWSNRRAKRNYLEACSELEAQFMAAKQDKRNELYNSCKRQFTDAIDHKAKATFKLESKLNDSHNRGYAKENKENSDFHAFVKTIQPMMLEPSHALMVDILAHGFPFALGGYYIPDPQGEILAPHVAVVVGYKRDKNAPGGVAYLVRNAWGIPPVWAHVKPDEHLFLLAIGKK